MPWKVLRFSGRDENRLSSQSSGRDVALLDALGIERAVSWGYSDGAVIAAMIGMRAPERCERLILEAFHFYRRKPSSRNFFQRFADHPELVTKASKLALHGSWRDALEECGAEELSRLVEFAAESGSPDEDLYGGRLGELRVPTTFVHGRRDPRTEPGEIERASEATAGAEVRFLEEGRHSPHSEEASWREWNGILGEVLFGK